MKVRIVTYNSGNTAMYRLQARTFFLWQNVRFNSFISSNSLLSYPEHHILGHVTNYLQDMKAYITKDKAKKQKQVIHAETI